MITILQAGGGMNTTMLILMGVIFFAFMVVPQILRQRKEKKFQNVLKKGDKVIMTSGIHGKLIDINNETCTIETMAGKIRFDKSAISMDATNALKNTK